MAPRTAAAAARLVTSFGPSSRLSRGLTAPRRRLLHNSPSLLATSLAPLMVSSVGRQRQKITAISSSSSHDSSSSPCTIPSSPIVQDDRSLGGIVAIHSTAAASRAPLRASQGLNAPQSPEQASDTPADKIALEPSAESDADLSSITNKVNIHSSSSAKDARSPPASLREWAERRSHFSVTDLTGPAWCEFAYQYNILNLSFLPVAKRPTSFRLASGEQMKPDRQLSERREKIQNRGRDIHEKLEKEVHPVRVVVRCKTASDAWALRLLKLVVGLRSLLDAGQVRELPVFGFLQGNLVLGVIDDISRRSLDDGRSARRFGYFLSDTKTRRSPTVPLEPEQKGARLQTMMYKRLFDGLCAGALRRLRARSVSSEGKAASNGDASSVEKTEVRMRKKRFLKAVEAAKSIALDTDAEAVSFADVWDTCGVDPTQVLSEDFISDAATLLQPGAEGVQTKATKPRERRARGTGGAVDRIETPLTIRTLDDAVRLLDDTFLEAVESARSGVNLPTSTAQSDVRSFACTGVLQQELTLVYHYRPRKSFGAFKRHRPSESAKTAIEEEVDALEPAIESLMGDSDSDGPRRSKRLAGRRGEASKQTALQTPSSDGSQGAPAKSTSSSDGAMTVEEMTDIMIRELNQSQQGPGLTTTPTPPPMKKQDPSLPSTSISTSTSTSTSTSASTSTSTSISPPSLDPSTSHDLPTSYVHSPPTLSSHLFSILSLWQGRRPAQGVSDAEVWKCGNCEYRVGCEWREEKAKERIRWAEERMLSSRQRRLQREEQREQRDEEKRWEEDLWKGFPEEDLEEGGEGEVGMATATETKREPQP